jgi:TPR repeat protein
LSSPKDYAQYGVCRQNGQGVSIDFRRSAHHLKLAADQGIADA